MVDFDCKAKMISPPNLPDKSPRSLNKLQILPPATFCAGDISPPSQSACSAYEHYVRLPELKSRWSSREFPGWENEPLLKPALHALEITFRFISITLSDPRPYKNGREWKRRLESLATNQVEIIALICEGEEREPDTRWTTPIVDLRASSGVLARGGSSAEVWKVPGEATIVNRTSEASLLPRLAAWQKSEEIASKILHSIECAMRRCLYTLGLGEPNLEGKPNLDYDAVCRPSELHSLRKCTLDHIENGENQTLYTIHQILESWIQASKQILERITAKIDIEEYEKASSYCWLLERIWRLLEDIENLHLLMDPDDFLRLKTQLKINWSSDSDAFCLQSEGLNEISKLSKDMKHRVPKILGVEVDPMGGPVIQEAAMKLYREKRSFDKINLLQGMQSVEAAVKRFFFTYKQILAIVMGTLEANGNRAVVASNSCDVLSQIFLEPTYYPSLDGAKTFLADFWEHTAASGGRHN
ncbi:hypothetical protein Nepgr_028992 [Nepenthes gracilis]|uniref:Nematode resistance protein-like HSPRO2 n=1 Tax=Nepenthes gracilis TaxID=150966 RepID=A0AAD3Y4K7_NEPGR|nr:hypothetical protein Nepgr_028992 [Nepenthes gracilis]